MSNELDNLLKEVAAKHGVALSSDDPILMLYTLCEHVAVSSGQYQAAQLENFKQEMESLTSRWSYDAKSKAEQVITVALTAAKAAMSEAITEASSEASNQFKRELDGAISSLRAVAESSHRAAVLAVAASVIAVVAAALAFFSSL